jgi:hypothetical protein
MKLLSNLFIKFMEYFTIIVKKQVYEPRILSESVEIPCGKGPAGGEKRSSCSCYHLTSASEAG